MGRMSRRLTPLRNCLLVIAGLLWIAAAGSTISQAAGAQPAPLPAPEAQAARAALPNPGRPILRRLNRAEYANAIRDLLALDIPVASLLPPDDAAYGFDNISDVLKVSPSLQERYLSAAEKISEIAVGDPDVGAV